MSNAFPIVGVGASAGGIEALEGFFLGMPPAPGLAIVIVTHLSPDRESRLHEIMARFTKLPVQVAVDGAQVLIDNVYVLPAQALIGIKNRKLNVNPAGSRRERKPIDIFLSALAMDVGELAAGVVLSGGDGDGTLGIKAIKERGGLTLAQIADGYGPQHPSMPESAVSSGFVDFAVPAQEMGGKLTAFVAGLANGAATGLAVPGGPTVEQLTKEIYDILRSQMGHDFSGYKTKSFMRRVQRRSLVSQAATLADYIEKLRGDPREISALFHDLLINVTNFFRDPEAFNLLNETVIPRLFEGKGANDIVRTWVPGCATGEEVYSIAMLMRAHMETLTAAPKVQIFATDIDEHALQVARSARYPAALLDGLSDERKQRFLVGDGEGYTIAKEVRELCIFSPHSVIRDPPFSRIDLVSCRNLLIYFGANVQAQVIPTFHYALRPNGYLFLGPAENAGQFEDLFAPVDKKHRIFRRRETAAPVRLPVLASARPGREPTTSTQQPAPGSIAFRQMIDDVVLDNFAPPRVVVNHDGDVVHYSNRTGKYLEAPPGAPTRQLLVLARRGLRLDLRNAFQEAVENGRIARRHGVALEIGGNVQLVNVAVEPLGDRGGTGQRLYLVLFEDQGTEVSREEALGNARRARDGTAAQLERELRETRDRLQALIEEYETALEELKSSNEELVSVNEEMQSSNEELEASKEELQSINEELHTVNGELSGKVDALDRANGDLQNLFDSTDVATLFLDRNLVIRSFTPAVCKIFNILPGDRGRPITDITSRLVLGDVMAGIAMMLAGSGQKEWRIEDSEGIDKYLVRAAFYERAGQIDGVALSFVNITQVTQATEAEAWQRLLVAELQHRTRNLLAIVQSVAQRTLGKGEAVASFVLRLAALGRVQSLLSQSDADKVGIGEIVRLELQAMGVVGEQKVRLDGPDVLLDPELVQTFGLAVHELATNALKYGALKQPEGRLDVAWRIDQPPHAAGALTFEWHESQVQMPAEIKAGGFGRQMIEQALAFTLRAKTSLDFRPDGVFCRIEIPLPTQAAAPSARLH